MSRFGSRFLDRVFTPGEQMVCSKGDATARLAARFAAKEAVMKALHIGWAAGVSWLDIEVVGDGGPPGIRLSGQALVVAQQLGVSTIHISLTHEKEYAAAFAVALKEAGSRGGSFCAL